ncbi:amidohydrolase 2 [mine drainage metagenome]|uniref:Amidohydrolase 2 n=1 Tax=mine drainage metagenome TaxID=410659 RepID=T0YGE6_9ZZZZ
MRSANDGIYETANNSGDRFLPIGTVSLYDTNAAIAKATRCIKDLKMLGIQIVSNVNGDPLGSPRFEPFYSAMENLGRPIWIHPTFMRHSYPWLKEFNTNIMVGWGFDITLSMIQLVGSGIIKRHRKLKFITHHLGSLVSLLGGRISTFLDNHNPGTLQNESFDSLSYLKAFYVDTAEGM